MKCASRKRKMRAAYRHGEIDDLLKPENKTPRYRELEKEFNKLIAEQRDILVKNEFDRIYSGAGGSGMNAFTSEDMTAYFVTVPANKLELWMWMESERILHPVFREFYAERDVVFEERRMRTDSTPLGKFQEEFNAMFWESSPYAWPTLGWPSDIPAISKAQADEFYAHLLLAAEHHAHPRGRFEAGQGRGAGQEVFRAHSPRPQDAAGRGDAGSEAARREADVCRSRRQTRRWTFSGTPCPFSIATHTRWKYWRRFCPRGRAGFTRGWCWAAASPPRPMPSQALHEMGGHVQRRRRGQGRPHTPGGRAGHLRQSWRS